MIIGHISSHEALLNSLKHLDKELELSLGSSKSFLERPWSANPVTFPSIDQAKMEIIPFPEEDESMGTFILGWHGPRINVSFLCIFEMSVYIASFFLQDHTERIALEMLFAYLADSPITPLQKNLVEIENPYCTDVDFSFLEFSTTSFFCELSNVPCEFESEV